MAVAGLVEDAQQALVGGQAEAVIGALQRVPYGIDQLQGFGRLVGADLLAAEDRPGQQQWSADLFVGDGNDNGEAFAVASSAAAPSNVVLPMPGSPSRLIPISDSRPSSRAAEIARAQRSGRRWRGRSRYRRNASGLE
jgi:hypothetical protein